MSWWFSSIVCYRFFLILLLFRSFCHSHADECTAGTFVYWARCLQSEINVRSGWPIQWAACTCSKLMVKPRANRSRSKKKMRMPNVIGKRRRNGGCLRWWTIVHHHHHHRAHHHHHRHYHHHHRHFHHYHHNQQHFDRDHNSRVCVFFVLFHYSSISCCEINWLLNYQHWLFLCVEFHFQLDWRCALWRKKLDSVFGKQVKPTSSRCFLGNANGPLHASMLSCTWKNESADKSYRTRRRDEEEEDAL